ncbi:phosphoribosylformylglycinamidin [Durotheca rogersii]|uniref:phosphoribosylformylglycinamidin n=1 Tax=Durotheca rogersii TaxID=419775 RepID=UPI002220199F|nr:phosphoribosylformylglycinamidin [Durotheca rogersii]KAI5862774.1 phosphoribosylformylglycinamidin [Durotheca rogersii]
MESLVLTGESCFTASEAKKLKDRINQTTSTKVANILGSWIYYAHIGGEKAAAYAKLQQLLPLPSATASPPLTHIGYTLTYYVVPRNISPWSSKATKVCEVCGLEELVRRVERGRSVTIVFEQPVSNEEIAFKDLLHDRMTEIISSEPPSPGSMFVEREPQPLEAVNILSANQDPLETLKAYNATRGLALDLSEMEYLVREFTRLGRPPNDIELFMFAQVNSEHCRHKQFNASWSIDGIAMDLSLFDMIRNTHKRTPDYTVSAYSDNAAVMQGEMGAYWAPDYATGSWRLNREIVHVLAKVETHNHPTAISPFPGAATGSGGEIRDEAAVGRGSTTKAGLCGFWVSDLLIPGHQAWEIDIGRPAHYASSLDIMLEGPIGSARFNNEFGRPSLAGCFRTLLTDGSSKADSSSTKATDWRGYHKPIMIAGGIGTVRPGHAIKNQADVHEGAHVVVLGGPAMLIGLGGGAASSNASVEGTAHLDFNSVQRGNPEMQRRAQMVINACVSLGDLNPIAMIHDVGAGGLSNALPELVKDAGFGGKFELRQVESADSSMSPLQIWCNEAQERYVLLINVESMNRFVNICQRERCGFSDVGTVVSENDSGVPMLALTDRDAEEAWASRPIDLPMSTLFPPGRRLQRIVNSHKPTLPKFDPISCLKAAFGEHLSDAEVIRNALQRVFWMPAVGSKSFLITIGDRTVGGLTGRDQMVGPWQVPVADVAVTAASFNIGVKTRHGEAMAMGEKPTLALISPAASARMAVAESLMNLGAADLMGDLRRVKLSANWMAAVNHPGEGAALYEAVRAIGLEMCPRLGISIPVGKDSTSMKASWRDHEADETRSVTAPVSVVISAFTVVDDIRKTWTPQLQPVEEVGETVLMFVDLANGNKAMGGSALAQSFGYVGREAPDVRDVDLITDYFDALSQLHQSGVVLAYHDRSDGGLITTVAEMMFAGRCGVDLMMDGIASSGSIIDMVNALFNEELGAVFQVRKSDETNFKRCFATCGPPPGLIRKFGSVQPKSKQTLTIRYGTTPLTSLDRREIHQWWAKTSFEMQKLRDNPSCAESEYSVILDQSDPGLSYRLTFDPSDTILPLTASITGFFGKHPRVAILREQGVNGHAEMAFAFKAAGFDPIDVMMTDIISGRSLADFVGIAACGGFSYGDVLGAGQGWAKSIMMHENTRKEFSEFFRRPDTFTLGVCNGCQMLSRLKDLIPGAQNWPTFVENTSQQFEARFSMVKIEDNKARPSVFLHGMHGSALPIVVSHGEGRASFSSPNSQHALEGDGLIPIRYVDNYLTVTEKYPFNPNGSPGGIAAVTNEDGRVLAMMPHPERTVLADTASYAPPALLEQWGEFGPWARMFRSARRWVG